MATRRSRTYSNSHAPPTRSLPPTGTVDELAIASLLASTEVQREACAAGTQRALPGNYFSTNFMA